MKKYLLLVLSLFLLVGCNQRVSLEDVNASILVCERNGGIEYIHAGEIVSVYCKNHAWFSDPVFIIQRTKGREYEK